MIKHLNIQKLVLSIFYFCYFIILVFAAGKLQYNTFFPWEKNENLVSIFLISMLLCLCISYLLPCDKKPSAFFLHLIFLIVVVPTSALILLNAIEPKFFMVVMMAFGLVITASQASLPLRLPPPIISCPALAKILLVLSIIFTTFMFVYAGANSINFNFYKIYEFRSLAKEKMPMILHYLLPLFTKTVIPSAVVLSLASKRFAIIPPLLFISLALAGVYHHKAAFFYSFFVVLIWFIAAQKYPVFILLISSILILWLGILELAANLKTPWIASLGLRRTFCVPAIINFYYWEYFKENTHYFWADSKISMGLFERPYLDSAPFLIGSEFIKDGAHANSGWIGSGMAQAGLFGVAIYSLILGLVLVFLDNLARRISFQFVVSFFFVFIITMVLSSDLLTVFLTHGFAGACLLCLVIKKND